MNVQLVNVVFYFQRNPLFVIPFCLEKSNIVATVSLSNTREVADRDGLNDSSLSLAKCYLTNGPDFLFSPRATGVLSHDICEDGIRKRE